MGCELSLVHGLLFQVSLHPISKRLFQYGNSVFFSKIFENISEIFLNISENISSSHSYSILNFSI